MTVIKKGRKPKAQLTSPSEMQTAIDSLSALVDQYSEAKYNRIHTELEQVLLEFQKLIPMITLAYWGKDDRVDDILRTNRDKVRRYFGFAKKSSFSKEQVYLNLCGLLGYSPNERSYETKIIRKHSRPSNELKGENSPSKLSSELVADLAEVSVRTLDTRTIVKKRRPET